MKFVLDSKTKNKMNRLFEEFKNTLIHRKNYEGVVCGYNDEHFILAVETTDDKNFFKRLFRKSVILEKYTDPKYRFTYIDESEILKQLYGGTVSIDKASKKAINAKSRFSKNNL